MTDNQLVAVEPVKRTKEDTQFKPGNNANPTGKGGPRKGWTPFAYRVRNLIDRKSAIDIMRTVLDPKLFNELPAMDAIIYQRAAQALKESGFKDAQFLVEYTDGKPDSKVKVEHAGKLAVASESIHEVNSWIRGFTGREEDPSSESIDEE